jgi:hypothetical protein
MTTPRSSTPTLIAALRVLGHDIETDDGVANGVMFEAADRLYELSRHMESLMVVLKEQQGQKQIYQGTN